MAIAAAWIFTSCWGNKAKDKHTDTATSGVIQISADESFRDIVQQEIDVFESIYVQAGIMPIYASEVDAINLLLKDSVRLAVASRQLTEAEKEGLAQKKLFPKEIKIATDGIALIVNKQNADSMISIPDLREILTGRITRWNQLNPGSKLGDLQLVFDNQNSSTVRFAIDSICRGDSLAGNLSAQHDNAAVIDYVSKTARRDRRDRRYVGGQQERFDPDDVLGAGDGDERQPQKPKRRRENSYKPFQAYIALGQYPLVRNMYVLLTDPRSGLASGFATFMASDRGQRIILRSGIVPATQNVRIVNVRENL